MSDPRVLLAVLSGAITVGYLAIRKLTDYDPREPPLAPQTIPIISHLIGLYQRTFNYYSDIYAETGAPIFTVPLPGQKMYVVSSPELIQSIQKQHRVFSIDPILLKFTSIISGASKEVDDILQVNMHGDDGHHGVAQESHVALKEGTKPANIHDMNREMLHEVANSLNLLEPHVGKAKRIKLYSWLRGALTNATTKAVYGPLNPYNDTAIAEAFWDFTAGIMPILINVLPSVFARKAIAARDKVSSAFLEYYTSNGQDSASLLTRLRYGVATRNKIPVEDIAKIEVGGTIAILVNTVPAAFWTLFYLHANPSLLSSVRAEVDACTDTAHPADGKVTKTIDIVTLKAKCPLLLSSYQETLRCVGMGTPVRQVTEDTHLDGYLLKKGALIQMPTRVVHSDAKLWGNNAAEFVPERFLPENKSSRPKDSCFRTFGGGRTLCPGRHFATNEILAVVALFISRMDMKPVDQVKGWEAPTSFSTGAAGQIMEPDEDVEVEITRREGLKEGIEWIVRADKGDKVFKMVTEDYVEE
ncbi:putative cytochrome P450 E-class, group IV [Triangularia verruculosa]|uniref:Cytochrome P450 E-class, group IV n=1 Tax=Triangularia verruculosa TaxID=2587418 RepID=A0AAN6XRZ2_9PEZI|nr:putative cytochrome P450 E-class, group IV [Triangularia verruculosa]